MDGCSNQHSSTTVQCPFSSSSSHLVPPSFSIRLVAVSGNQISQLLCIVQGTAAATSVYGHRRTHARTRRGRTCLESSLPPRLSPLPSKSHSSCHYNFILLAGLAPLMSEGEERERVLMIQGSITRSVCPSFLRCRRRGRGGGEGRRRKERKGKEGCRQSHICPSSILSTDRVLGQMKEKDSSHYMKHITDHRIVNCIN